MISDTVQASSKFRVDMFKLRHQGVAITTSNPKKTEALSNYEIVKISGRIITAHHLLLAKAVLKLGFG